MINYIVFYKYINISIYKIIIHHCKIYLKKIAKSRFEYSWFLTVLNLWAPNDMEWRYLWAGYINIGLILRFRTPNLSHFPLHNCKRNKIDHIKVNILNHVSLHFTDIFEILSTFCITHAYITYTTILVLIYYERISSNSKS